MLGRAEVIYPSEACTACGGHGFRNLPEAGAKLRRIREHYGVTSRALARALGVSEQRVCDWQAGRRPVPVEITEQWEPTSRKLAGLPQLPEPSRESFDRDRVAPHVDPYALRRVATDHEMPAPSEPPPKIWIPRSLREQGWSVVDGQVMRPADEAPRRRK
jgi:transcriptional regulator with XRE-family HTH domain